MIEINKSDGIDDTNAAAMLKEARRLAYQMEYLSLKSGLSHDYIDNHIANEASHNPNLIRLTHAVIYSWYN